MLTSILKQKYNFKTVFLWVAFKNGTGIIDVLRKYIDCLETTKRSGDQKKANAATKGYVALLVLVLMLFFGSDTIACHQPPIAMACYRPKTICYGFVPHIFKERKDGQWRYYIKEVLTELPCPRK